MAQWRCTRYSVQCGRDAVGRIVGKTETVCGETHTYGYTYERPQDESGRLTEVRRDGVLISEYLYDSNGNRLSHTGPGGTVAGTYDAQDRLLSYGDATYSHSDNGELQSKTVNGQSTLFDYDALAALRGVTLPDGTAIEYVIDGAGRRVGKKVNGLLVQAFLYSSALTPVAELDGAGNVVSRFVYASRLNVPDYMVRGGATYRIISDHLGSPRLVVNADTAEIAQRMDLFSRRGP